MSVAQVKETLLAIHLMRGYASFREASKLAPSNPSVPGTVKDVQATLALLRQVSRVKATVNSRHPADVLEVSKTWSFDGARSPKLLHRNQYV